MQISPMCIVQSVLWLVGCNIVTHPVTVTLTLSYTQEFLKFIPNLICLIWSHCRFVLVDFNKYIIWEQEYPPCSHMSEWRHNAYRYV